MNPRLAILAMFLIHPLIDSVLLVIIAALLKAKYYRHQTKAAIRVISWLKKAANYTTGESNAKYFYQAHSFWKDKTWSANLEESHVRQYNSLTA